MEKPVFISELRLHFQCSIPFENDSQAETWYNMLKEMVKSQSEKSIITAQISKMLEPCCKEKPK